MTAPGRSSPRSPQPPASPQSPSPRLSRLPRASLSQPSLPLRRPLSSSPLLRPLPRSIRPPWSLVCKPASLMATAPTLPSVSGLARCHPRRRARPVHNPVASPLGDVQKSEDV
ncbi:unnamed protein product [Penicillium camemberti]|uniref:Str. FM013 n=1 Tax=Penicillium camemberti (strain FM 013) TaxID=1429867 RepID=A0A0G4PJX5_PENC3|nr:unnamed protein product [Penicillium camemberti]